MALHKVKEITTPAPKVDEMPTVTQEGPLQTGGNPEVEDEPHLSKESP